MRTSTAAILLTSFLTIATTPNAPAQTGTSLRALAVRDGYIMQWLLPERSVSLVRPGMAIVVRPGASMYYVNNHVEFSDRVPLYQNGDLYVSSTFAARLSRLAVIAASAYAGMGGPPAPYAPVAAEPAATGAITMSARPLPGRQAVVVNGHAPSSAPITITLLGTLSSDLPTIVVSRHDVQPDVNGNFQAEIPIAPDYVENTLLQIVASSVSGTTPASAQLTLGTPNAGVTVPLEQRLNPVP